MNKICSKCKIEKPTADFYLDNSNLDKLRTNCKICDRGRKRNRKSEKYVAQKKKIDYEGRIKKSYGLTLQALEEMMKSQNYSCKICKTTEFKGQGKKLNIDHCHITGKVRGLLCSGCNTGLGSFRDKTEFLKEAILYLETHQKIPIPIST